MRFKVGIGVFLVLICVGSIVVQAQSAPSAAERVDNLKLQLIDVKAREEAARLHDQQLDEALKPENIERSLAGVGSTRPEELREQRRRQLSAEKASVTAQLNELVAQRGRLEAAISTAEAEAYHQSALGSSPVGNGLLGLSPLVVRWLVVASVIGVLAIVLFVAMLFRKASSRTTGI